MLESSLQKYLEIEKLFNRFFSKIDFCQDRCVGDDFSLYNLGGSQIPCNLGCCVEDKSVSRTESLSKKSLNELIKDRDEIYGTYQSLSDGCRYHNLNNGCVLDSHKSPICLGFICPPFVNYLKSEYGIEYNTYYMIQGLEMLLNGNLSDLEFSSFKDEIEGFISKVIF